MKRENERSRGESDFVRFFDGGGGDELVKCMTNGAAAKGLKFREVFDPEQNGATLGTAGIPLSSLCVVRHSPVTICRRCGNRVRKGTTPVESRLSQRFTLSQMRQWRRLFGTSVSMIWKTG